jgi:anti-anti-sigma factor
VTDLADLEATDAGDGLVVARVRGDLDLSNLYSVHTALLEMLPNEAIGLVVDLGGVTFLDSSGVEALFRLQASLEVRQQRLAVAIPAGATIRRALELSGAPGEMPLRGSVDEALAVLRAGPEHGAQETD